MQETADTAVPNTPPAPRTDRLELVKELGRGSIGVVHQAKNPQINRVTALRKFEVPQWLDDVNELINRILAEARATSSLDHPNIARLYTCGYKGFTIFMTSEFIEGQSLKEIMSSRQPELAEVLAWAKQLCAALDYAHDKGVFHHFLNPANIKILPDGTLKILDFGLLKDKHLLSQTPAKKLENEPYLSPEEIKGKLPDRAANLFSAGTILYQLYTSRNPFAGKHLGEVDRAIMDVVPNPLNVAHPRVPPTISATILKALSKSRAERFQTGGELVAALEEAVKAAPVIAPAVKPAAPKPPAPDQASQNGNGTPATPAAAPAANKTQVLMPPPPATARIQVKTSNNQWKLVGAVAACLVVVALMAFLLQGRRPVESTIESTPTPPAATKSPANVAAAPTPAPVNQPEVSEPEVREPEIVVANPVRSSVKRTKAVRAPRVASAPAVTTPQQGELSISSVPADATVAIEGFPGQTWRTPQTVTAIPAGSYKVTVSKPGYAPEIRAVQITAAYRMAVEVHLNAVKGWLTVGGSPAGASVVIDGKEMGAQTPATFILDPATHRVLLRKNGYLEVSSEVQLSAGQTVSYSPTLMVAGRTDNIKIMGGSTVGRIFGGGGGSSGKARIEIKTEPKGAQVLINGTPLQKTTPLEIQVEAGNYDIILQKDGYKDIHESAIVGIEDKVRINKTLTR
jgi:serine/threonine-protein kinase